MHRTRLLQGASLLAITIAATPATAQDDGGSRPLAYDLGTLFVTGEKVERDLMTTASSVTLYTAEEIAEESAGNTPIPTSTAGSAHRASAMPISSATTGATSSPSASARPRTC